MPDGGRSRCFTTGCRAEHARLRMAECLVKLIAVYCNLAWWVFWTTMIGRSAPRADPYLAVTDHEIALLDRLVPDLPASERFLPLRSEPPSRGHRQDVVKRERHGALSSSMSLAPVRCVHDGRPLRHAPGSSV